jgi:peptidase C25-like protein
VSRHWMTLALLLFATVSGRAATPRQWVVVTAPLHRAALEPLCEFRKQQGFHVTVVETTAVLTDEEIRTGAAGKLRAHVNKLCREFSGTSFVLLVGAVGGGTGLDAKSVVPALQGSVGRMKGEPTDSGYGCPGAGLRPTVAVGRFPARTAIEAAAMVRKTLDLERDERPGPWRRRLTVLAGVPAYNPFVDRLIESLALARLDRIDNSWTGRAIYHTAESRFCVPDADLHARALQYVQQGQMLTLYLGHSDPRGFWADRARYLDREDWENLRIERGAGVFATFGCCGCQLRGHDGEGYGVAAMRNPHGPTAVLGSHGICYAAMVQLASEGFVGSFLSADPPERLGTAWLALLDGLANGSIDSLTFSLLDKVDGDSSVPQATQRQEHLEMFVLLGDPALRLPTLPGDVKLKSPVSVRAGTTLAVEGTLPPRLAGARVCVTLERAPGSAPVDLEPLPKEAGPVRDRVMRSNHDKANRLVLAEAEVVSNALSFTANLDVPKKLPSSPLIVRAYAATNRAEGQGVLRPATDR